MGFMKLDKAIGYRATNWIPTGIVCDQCVTFDVLIDLAHKDDVIFSLWEWTDEEEKEGVLFCDRCGAVLTVTIFDEREFPSDEEDEDSSLGKEDFRQELEEYSSRKLKKSPPAKQQRKIKKGNTRESNVVNI